MSDFFENNQETNEQLLENNTADNVVTDESEEQSTVFSAPVEHEDRAIKNAGKKRLISIIAACLAVAVLIGGTIAVIKLIPELKEDEAPDSVFEDITVIDKDASTFTNVDITNTNGTFKFVTKQITATDDAGKTTTSTHWSVEDIDISKLSTDSMNSVISSAASVTALREITTKDAADCGFDKPIIKVSVVDNSNNSFSFVVGDKSPDGLGYYFKLDNSDTIYVVPTNELQDFQFNLVDLADKTSIPATIFNTDTSANKTEDGSYAYFDSLTLSGTLYGDTITITNNNDGNALSDVIPYIITTPTKRYARPENITSLIGLFSSKINVAGNYAFDINDKTLKEFGLDNPDAIATLTINGESKSFKFSVIDDSYCAVIYDGATMIRKISLSSFAFLSLKPENFYHQHLFLYSINDVSALELIDGEERVKFDISYTEDENSTITYNVKANGEKIDASNFQTFYADLAMTQCSDFSIEQPSTKAVSSIKFSFHKGSSATVEFYKINETQYQYSVDNIPMGRITSAAYTKLIRNIKAQADSTKTE